MFKPSSNLSFLAIVLAITMSLFVVTRTTHNNQETAMLAEYAVSEAAIFASKSAKKINVEHLKCLATNIYHEAGSEPYIGQVAVARVVLNRIKHGFAPNPCKVVYQITEVPLVDDPDSKKKVCQFSWVCEGKNTPVRNQKYQQAEEIARMVLVENKWHEVIPNNVLFFHAVSVNPGWNYQKVMTIGNHVFYSKGKEKH